MLLPLDWKIMAERGWIVGFTAKVYVCPDCMQKLRINTRFKPQGNFVANARWTSKGLEPLEIVARCDLCLKLLPLDGDRRMGEELRFFVEVQS